MPVLIMALMTALSLEDKKLPHTAGIIASASVIAVIALIAVSGINTSQSFKSDGSLRFPAEFWCSVVLCLVSLGAAAGIFVLLKKDRSIMKAALPLTIAACTGCCMWAVYFPAANADKAAAYAGLSGEIGAKVKFLSFNLAKWSTTFDVFKVTLFEGSLAWTFTEESWGQLNAKWNTLMNEGSHKWWRANPEEVVVPYRIPEKGTNF